MLGEAGFPVRHDKDDSPGAGDPDRAGERLARMKSEFIARVNHELRTPLTAVRGALGLLAGGVAGELPEQARQLVESAKQGSEELARRINDILDVDKLEFGRADVRPEPVEVRRIAMAAPTLQRILYVEDDPNIRELGKLALEAVGKFTVEPCNSGAEAVEKGPGFNPDLILLDVMMPGMDGPTTLAELRKHAGLEKTPVVFLTAQVQPEEIASYKAMGAVGVVTKPFDPMTLPSTLKRIWSEHRG